MINIDKLVKWFHFKLVFDVNSLEGINFIYIIGNYSGDETNENKKHQYCETHNTHTQWVNRWLNDTISCGVSIS